MKISRIKIAPLSYALRKPIVTARGEIRERRGFRIAVFDDENRCGIGEALPLEEFGTESVGGCEKALSEMSSRLLSRPIDVRAGLGQVLESPPTSPAACCGFDIALHDLWGCREKRPIASLLNKNYSHSIAVNAAIGGFTADSLLSVVQSGYQTLKTKLSGDVSTCVQRVRAVRKALPSSIKLRLDANGVFSWDEAEYLVRELSDARIEFIEEPITFQAVEEYRKFCDSSPIPIALDETLCRLKPSCEELSSVKNPIVVLKPMMWGGLGSCVHFLHEIAKAKPQVVITTSFEAAVGVAACTHLAAAFGDPRLAHGLAAVEQIGADFPRQCIPDRGRLSVPRAFGLGLGQDFA